MTYNVFCGTLNLTQLHYSTSRCPAIHRANSVAFRQRLLSASTSELIVPCTHCMYNRQSANVHSVSLYASARAWNTLTPSVQSSESQFFRRRLKTELFSRSFPPPPCRLTRSVIRNKIVQNRRSFTKASDRQCITASTQ